jgi:gluconolactonase
MKRTTMAALAAALAVGTAAEAQAPGPGAPAPAQAAVPPAPAPYIWTGPTPGEVAYQIAGIPGVVAPGARWELVLADFNALDGMVGTPDGSVLITDEQSSSLRKLVGGRLVTYLTDTHGAGASSIDAQGRLFAVQRACTDPGLRMGPACIELTAVSQLLPERRMLTNSFPDGRPLGRLSDLVADGDGGAYFTARGAYHVARDGKMHTVAEGDIRANGIILSRDNRTLYVTNDTSVDAFDVQADGTTRNRRVFGQLSAAGGGDGMTIDAEGRVYVTANDGVHVFAADGRKLGVIQTPRRPITLAFSGPDKKTLYISGTGVVGPNGQPWATPEGVRNTAFTLYRIPMLAGGFKGRAK